MTTMVERTEGLYEVQRTSYGEAYVRCQGYIVVECDGGERLTLSASQTLCSCGADNKTLVSEDLASRRSSEEVTHPWDEEYVEWRRKRIEYLQMEYNDWLQWRVIQ